MERERTIDEIISDIRTVVAPQDEQHLDEVVKCFDSGAYPSAIQSAWKMCCSHLRRWICSDNGRLEAFNGAMFQRFKDQWTPISDLEDLERRKRLSDDMVINAAATLKGFDNNLVDLLAEKRKRRNGHAHGNLRATQTFAKSYIDDLESNFFARFPFSRREGDTREQFTPKVKASLGRARLRATSSDSPPELRAAVAHYNRLPVDYPAEDIRGPKMDCSQIRLPDWAPGVHYEFLHRRRASKSRQKGIGAELHLEGVKGRRIADRVKREFESEPVGPLQTPLQWDQEWQGNDRRLLAVFPFSTEPGVVSATMRDLINLTRGKVGIWLAELDTR